MQALNAPLFPPQLLQFFQIERVVVSNTVCIGPERVGQSLVRHEHYGQSGPIDCLEICPLDTSDVIGNNVPDEFAFYAASSKETRFERRSIEQICLRKEGPGTQA
jgi:hypothetical protein